MKKEKPEWDLVKKSDLIIVENQKVILSSNMQFELIANYTIAPLKANNFYGVFLLELIYTISNDKSLITKMDFEFVIKFEDEYVHQNPPNTLILEMSQHALSRFRNEYANLTVKEFGNSLQIKNFTGVELLSAVRQVPKNDP